jgi:hypothetical protein
MIAEELALGFRRWGALKAPDELTGYDILEAYHRARDKAGCPIKYRTGDRCRVAVTKAEGLSLERELRVVLAYSKLYLAEVG